MSVFFPMMQLMLSKISLAMSLVLAQSAVVEGRLFQRRRQRRQRERMQHFDVFLKDGSLGTFIIAVTTELVPHSNTTI